MRTAGTAGRFTQHYTDHIHHADPAIATTRLRGMQAVLLTRRWHLDIHLEQYLRTHTELLTAAAPHPDWNALLRHPDPADTAAAVLHLLGIPASQTPHITLADTAPDGSHLNRHGHDTPVPAAARRHLAAARIAREQRGARADDPLHPWPITPPFPRHIRDATSGLLSATGLNAPHTALLRKDGEAATRRLGMTCERLPSTPVDTWAGPAPHPRYLPQPARPDRVTPDPAGARRLSPVEAVVLSCAARGVALKARDRIASIDRARTSLRAQGILDGDNQLSPAAARSLLGHG